MKIEKIINEHLKLNRLIKKEFNNNKNEILLFDSIVPPIPDNSDYTLYNTKINLIKRLFNIKTDRELCLLYNYVSIIKEWINI